MAVTDDLENQVRSLKAQLANAVATNQQLIKTLGKENKELTIQLAEAHDARAVLQKEVKTATKYMSELEDRMYSSN